MLKHHPSVLQSSDDELEYQARLSHKALYQLNFHHFMKRVESSREYVELSGLEKEIAELSGKKTKYAKSMRKHVDELKQLNSMSKTLGQLHSRYNNLSRKTIETESIHTNSNRSIAQSESSP